MKIKILSPRCVAQSDDLPRLGMVTLSTDLTIERDASRLIAHDETVLHVSRIAFENPITPDSLHAMGPDLSAAADLLVPGVDLAAIAFACTSASIVIRNDVVFEAIAKVRPGVPVLTPSWATLVAFRALKVRRIALLTPYQVDTTRAMIDYFEQQGISVQTVASFNMADDRDIARLDRTTLIDAAVSLNSSHIDAVFMSCTALPAVDVIDEIEARLGKPVISSNQATLWAMRGLAGLPLHPKGVGRLFATTWPQNRISP